MREAVLVLEASADGGALKTARKGTSLYEIGIAGRAAHAGLEPQKGVNATLELAHQVQAVAALADPGAGTTVTPTAATSGTTAQHGAGRRPGSRSTYGRGRRRSRSASTPRCAGSGRCCPVPRSQVDGGINRRAAGGGGVAAALRAGAGDRRTARAARADPGGRRRRLRRQLHRRCRRRRPSTGSGQSAEVRTPTDEHVLVDRLADRTLLLRALIEDLLTASWPLEPGARR